MSAAAARDRAAAARSHLRSWYGEFIGADSPRYQEVEALCDDIDALTEGRVEGREGMVTVFDHEGRYLGCMGIETWRELLVSEPAS